jgi:hypothetical protein
MFEHMYAVLNVDEEILIAHIATTLRDKLFKLN